MNLSVAVNQVLAEYERASMTHGPMRSPHEGYAVLLEEVDELWDEIKRKPSEQTAKRLREEAVQVAAMALRFLVDICAERPK